jgi:hypothetical protein
LGVEVGLGTTSPASGGDAAAVPVSAESASVAVSSQSCNEAVVNDPNAINYVQNYNEIVLGKKPTNWGNTILIGMIGLILVGGGGLIITREKLVSFSFTDTVSIEGEYPADVAAMLPKIVGLNSKTRKSLQNILNDPRKADKAIDLLDAVVKRDEE